eukprot:7471914-Heterocapsa_arctica.AAC.1
MAALERVLGAFWQPVPVDGLDQPWLRWRRWRQRRDIRAQPPGGPWLAGGPWLGNNLMSTMRS